MMTPVFQKYAAVLLPFLILTIGATQTVLAHPRDLTVLIPYAILVVGAVGTFGVKLIPDSRWQGRWKTGIAIVTTILSALLPFLLPGGFDPATSVPVIVVAVLNALATQLGVSIRVDEPTPEDIAAAHLAAAQAAGIVQAGIQPAQPVYASDITSGTPPSV